MAQIVKIPGPDHPISIQPNPTRITVHVGERLIAETTAALTMREAAYPPIYYIPLADVDRSALRRSGTRTYCPYKGHCSYYSIIAAPGSDADAGGGSGAEVVDAMWTYEQPYPSVIAIDSHAAFFADRVAISVGDPVSDWSDASLPVATPADQQVSAPHRN